MSSRGGGQQPGGQLGGKIMEGINAVTPRLEAKA